MTGPMEPVLLVLRSDGVGGSERTMAGLVDLLDRHGVERDLVTLRRPRFGPGPLAPLRPRVLEFSGPGPVRRLRQLHWLRRRLRDGRYGTVIAFGPSPNALVALARPRRGGPRIVVSERGDPFAPRRRAWNRRLLWTYRRADVLMVPTELLASELRGERRFPTDIRVVPNALDPAIGILTRGDARPPVIAAVGRFAPVKRFQDLIEAFAALGPIAAGWRLVLMGDGDERPRLEALVADRGLGDRVEVAGFHPAPWERLADADVFVLSSAHEGFANVIVEAMASGCAVVASDCRFGPRELIEDGVSGVLYPTGDVAALTERLDALLADPARRAALARAGTERARAFLPEAVADRWLALLTEDGAP